MLQDRYIRQSTFKDIGGEGQRRLHHARVAIIGLGALGSRTAEVLARAGVGYIRLIDRDIVYLSNLQRMSLFDENDAAEEKPKALAAGDHLSLINSDNQYDIIIENVGAGNIDSLIADVDLVIDGTDNSESKFLIGEACHHIFKPWIYGMAVGSGASIKSFLPGKKEPCIRCMTSYDGSKHAKTCVTEGVLGTTSEIAAAVQAGEALKILTSSDNVIKDLIIIDDWFGRVRRLPISKSPDCPVCQYGQYSFYGQSTGIQAAEMCGKDSVQVIPAEELSLDFDALAQNLNSYGTVKQNAFTVDFDDGKIGIKIFKNGRAIIKHVSDPDRAKALYTKYIENSI